MDRVVIDHQIMGGVPCVRGTRIPVVTVLGLLGEGLGIDQIMQHYPRLIRADALDHRSAPLTSLE